LKKEKIDFLNKEWDEFVKKNRIKWVNEYSPSFLRVLTTFTIKDLTFKFEEIEYVNNYYNLPYFYLQIEMEIDEQVKKIEIQSIGKEINSTQDWVINGEFEWEDPYEGKGYLLGEDILSNFDEEIAFQKLLSAFELTKKVEKIAEVIQKEEDEMEAEKLKNQFASLIKKASKQQEIWTILIEHEDCYLELKGDIKLNVIKKSDK